MVVALTAYAFMDNVENGGTGVKLGIFRCEGPRVALRAARSQYQKFGRERKSVWDPNHSAPLRMHSFSILWPLTLMLTLTLIRQLQVTKKDRKAEDVFFVDCNVKGSSTGTATSPKFSLLVLFRDAIFPLVANLVKKGGRFADYTPVFQGDNAGPHDDGTFKKYVMRYCMQHGWLWEPQACKDQRNYIK